MVVQACIRSLAALALLFAAHVGPAHAQSLGVEPLFIETEPGQSAAVRVRNSSSVRQTVEVSIAERVPDEGGKVARIPADDAFILFPPQGVIEPNSVQVFRVQPIEPTVDRSRSYYFTVRQVPVDLSLTANSGAQLQVVFAFDVAMHTVPRGAASKPTIVSAVPALTNVSAVSPDDPNRSPDPAVRAQEPRIEVPGVEVMLRNEGNKYLYIQNFEYLVEGVGANGQAVELPILDEETILEAVSMPLVLPGTERKFTLPYRDSPPLNSVTVRMRPRAGT